VSSKLESDVCYRVFDWRHLVKELTAVLAESNDSLPRADCLYTGISSGLNAR